MNRKNTPSIDGFTVRRRPQSGGGKVGARAVGDDALPGKFLRNPAGSQPADVHSSRSMNVLNSIKDEKISRSDIDESLNSIDQEKQPKKRRFRLSKKSIKYFVIAFVLIGLGLGGYFAYRFSHSLGNIVKGNLMDVITQKNKELKKDSIGNTHILVFGTSEDDPNHPGADLTDSIMVLTVNQTTKKSSMFSVPRDLPVEYGQACASGYRGKINVVYQCNSDGGKDIEKGSRGLASKVGEVFGIDVQYYVKVNYTALKQAVDAVGGITVQIESDDPRGIYDNNFDWQCGYKCYMVKYPNGPATLDGAHALALARARNDAGGYGLPGSNFDREQYQQKILVALKEKAISAGTLTNPKKVDALMTALGDNVRTSFDMGEVKTLTDLANTVKPESITRISLVQEGEAVLNGSASPVAGDYNFTQVQAYIAKKLSVVAGIEQYTAVVMNASDTAGLASKKVEELKVAGITATADNAPASAASGAVALYDLSDGKLPSTREKLVKALGVSVKGTTLPQGVQSDADFVIILGNEVN